MAITFDNLPRNAVRHVLQHMNARTAARFAAASKEYSANARLYNTRAVEAQM